MTTIAVTAPDPGFTGSRAGVAFENGTGEVDADDALALAYFERHGYALGEPSAPARHGRARVRPAEPVVEADREPEG